MLSKKNSMVTMVTDEFLENRIILQKSVATIGFIWFFWFQKCTLLYIFAQVFLVMRSIRSHISLFRLGFTPTLKPRNQQHKNIKKTSWQRNMDMRFYAFHHINQTLIWFQIKSYVARNNTDFNIITSVQKLFEESLEHITGERWMKAIRHVVDIKKSCWEKGNIRDIKKWHFHKIGRRFWQGLWIRFFFSTLFNHLCLELVGERKHKKIIRQTYSSNQRSGLQSKKTKNKKIRKTKKQSRFKDPRKKDTEAESQPGDYGSDENSQKWAFL